MSIIAPQQRRPQKGTCVWVAFPSKRLILSILGLDYVGRRDRCVRGVVADKFGR